MQVSKSIRNLAAGLAISMAATAAVADMKKDIVDTAVSAGSFNTLVTAVQAAGLVDTLKGPGPFTVFAPTDEAFAKIPKEQLDALLKDKEKLRAVLTYHVVPGAVMAKDVAPGKVATAQGQSLNVDVKYGNVMINQAKVVKTDIVTSNGVIHVIDGLLLPTLVDIAVHYDDGTNKFSTLASAVTAAGLADTLNGAGPFTVFAPTDAAFAALKAQLGEPTFNAILADKAKLTRILTYHVISAQAFSPMVTNGASIATVASDKLTFAVAGGKVSITDSTKTPAKVALADVPARNGVIHVIDKVLLPPGL